MHILEKRPVRLMTPFLHRAAEPEQRVRHFLSRGAKHVDEGARERFVVFGEERDGESGGGGAAGSGDGS